MKVGLASLLCSLQVEGSTFTASSFHPCPPPHKATPSPPGESLEPQGCESGLPAALPVGSLLSHLQIRHLQPRLFSLRCLFRKEFSLGTSHTHPGGFARFSREWFHEVATCHLWAERGNCSGGCWGIRMAAQVSQIPNHNICGAHALCQALPSSQTALPTWDFWSMPQ